MKLRNLQIKNVLYSKVLQFKNIYFMPVLKFLQRIFYYNNIEEGFALPHETPKFIVIG